MHPSTAQVSSEQSLGIVGTAIHQTLERCSAFADVPRAYLLDMAASANVFTYQRGKRLWSTGDEPHSLVVIRSGLVKIVREGSQGRIAICGLFGPAEAIGILPLLKNVPRPASAQVVTDTVKFISIPREAVLAGIKAYPAFGISLACSMHSQLTSLHDKIDMLSAGSVESRLATALLKLYARFGDDFEDGTATIPFSLSRKELSDLVSTSFETVIRVMTRWEREDVIVTESNGFTIRNLASLEDAAAGGGHSLAGRGVRATAKTG